MVQPAAGSIIDPLEIEQPRTGAGTETLSQMSSTNALALVQQSVRRGYLVETHQATVESSACLRKMNGITVEVWQVDLSKVIGPGTPLKRSHSSSLEGASEIGQATPGYAAL